MQRITSGRRLRLTSTTFSQVEISSGAKTTIATGLNNPVGLVLSDDKSSLYVTNYRGNTIQQVCWMVNVVWVWSSLWGGGEVVVVGGR